MNLGREEIKDLSQKKLLFWLIDIEEKISHKNLKSIEDISGVSYLYAVFYDAEAKKFPDSVELSYDDYVRIIMSTDKINGIAIDIGEDFLYVRRCDFRWFMIMTEEEKYIRDESDVEKMYNRHLENIRCLWLSKKYKDIEEYLSIIDSKYEVHSSEINYYYGKIYETMGYSIRAEQFYRNAVKLEGDNFWLFYQLALYYNRNGEYDKEWITCNAAYKQFNCKCSGYNVWDESIDGIVRMMINNPKCKSINRMIYMKFLNRLKLANEEFDYKKYTALQ